MRNSSGGKVAKAALYQIAPGVWITPELVHEIADARRVGYSSFARAPYVRFETICVRGITLCVELGDGNAEAENLCFSLWSDDDFKLRFLEMLRKFSWKGAWIIGLFEQYENNFTAVRNELIARTA